jgi:hypothetical protein
LGYFLETNEEDLPWLEVPFHTVVKLSPIAYGCKVEYIPLDVPSVSTHRDKPKVPGSLDKRSAKKIRPDALFASISLSMWRPKGQACS